MVSTVHAVVASRHANEANLHAVVDSSHNNEASLHPVVASPHDVEACPRGDVVHIFKYIFNFF